MPPISTDLPDNHVWTTRHYYWASASLLLCVSPVLMILIEWCLATAILGRPPQLATEPPASISPALGIIHSISALFVFTPFVTPFILPIIWWKKAGHTPQANLIAAGCFILPLACIYILRTDPTSIGYWWLSNPP